jgi:hypothetical protein
MMTAQAKGSSFLLQGICPSDSADTLVFNLPVTWFHPDNAIRDLTLPGFYLRDMDGDGKMEIISGIMAGFRVEPRMLFVYNLVTKELVKTPRMGACAAITEFSDLNGDQLPEILLHTYAIDNNEGKISIPLDDHSAWLVVFKPTLVPLFPPVQFKGKYKAVTSISTGSGISRKIVSLCNGKTRNAGNPELHLYDVNGQLLKKTSIPDHRQGLFYSLLKQDRHDVIFLSVSDGRLIEFDTTLNIRKSRQKSNCQASSPLKVDLDGDRA